MNFQLDLLDKWCIHNVFHTGLLLSQVETEVHGLPAPSAIPDLLGGVKQYNMETILESCKPTNGHGTQYLVKWLGYPLLENSWIPTSSFATSSKELIYKFHQAHSNAYRAPTVANSPA